MTEGIPSVPDIGHCEGDVFEAADGKLYIYEKGNIRPINDREIFFLRNNEGIDEVCILLDGKMHPIESLISEMMDRAQNYPNK